MEFVGEGICMWERAVVCGGVVVKVRGEDMKVRLYS